MGREMEVVNYPKAYRENLAWRREILVRSKVDEVYQLKIKELFHRDILFAFNAFFYTLDVRRRPEHQQPFCTYPFQDETILSIVEAINTKEDIVIEKSRDMGVSWMVILIFLWFWLDPKGGGDFLLGSRIEDYVDKKGDMRTLMEKARYTIYRLPKWLRPRNFRRTAHDNFMRLQNPETGASITGESNNPNFSTGGRYLGILFDEFSKWENTDKSAWSDAGDATPCRIAAATAFGAAGKYYELVTEPSKKKLTLHWSLHPVKANGLYCVWPKEEDSAEVVDSSHWKGLRSPWYDNETLRRTPDEIAQNLDIDYIGAGAPVFKGKSGKRVLTLLRSDHSPVRYCSFSYIYKTFETVGVPRDTTGVLVLWEEPRKDTSYAIGVDVAEGIEGGDFSVVKVLSRSTRSIVASLYTHVDEVQLADQIVAISRLFSPNWTGIETNGPGLATFDLCAIGLRVSNLFMMPRYDQAKGEVSFSKGWRTTSVSREILVSGITEWLLDSSGWCDPRLVREMTAFVHDKTGKPKARSGANDDEVIAFGISLQVDLLAPKERKISLPNLMDNGLPIETFKLVPTGEQPLSIEERCLETVLSKRSDGRSDELIFFEDARVGSIFETALEMMDLWE